MTTECKNCKKNYASIDEETGLCYYCHIKKFGTVGKHWQPRVKHG
jgi:hypothetical protein